MSIIDLFPRFKRLFSGQFLYPTLPDKCVCLNCGYVLENPGEHCRFIRCPKCGSPMRRGI